jgi:hypothetical protein
MECKVCHEEWTAEEIGADGVCRYCWDAHGEEWVG